MNAFMSGSSTLRICLAGMAPALTEVTARLKLQDSSLNTESLNNRLVDNNSNDSKGLHRTCQGEFNGLGGLKRLNEDRPSSSDLLCTVRRNGTHFGPTVCQNTRNSHFSCVVRNASTLTTHFDHNKAPTVCENTRNSHLSCVVGSHFDPKRPASVCQNTTTSNFSCVVGNSNIKSLSTTGHIGHFQQGGLSSKANTFIDNLKIMNQPHIAADKLPAEQDKVEVDSKIVGEGLVNSGSCMKVSSVKPPVMVNGNSELNRKNVTEAEIRCAEKRDVQTRIGNPSLDNRPLSLTVSSTQTVNLSGVKMGICVQNNQTCSQSQLQGVTKSDVQMDDKSKDDLRKECGRKQAYLERKVDILLRRLKRMKGKVVEMHTREQLKHFVNYQHKNLQKVAKTIKNEAPGPDELKEHFLSNEEVKNMSTAQLVKLVKTYQPNQNTPATDVSTKLRLANSSAVVMDPVLRDKSLKISERLTQRVLTASAELDSDATASSSGGESGDDDNTPSSSHPPADLPPLLKRAEWKWAVDRAAVVSRWTWLQAQVSDLEYRIRQQSLVHRQLRNSKGGVVLGDQPTAVEILRKLQGIPSKQVGTTGVTSVDGSPGSNVSPCNISAVMSNVDKQASRLTQSLGNCLSPASSTFGSPAGSSKIASPFINGLTDSPCSTTTTCETMSESSPVIPSDLRLTEKTSDLFEHNILADTTCQAARCRPLRSYRKRKILRTIGLYKNSAKAAQLSDVKCRCYPPASPCPICGGRYNNTLTIDPDAMSLKERIAILDPSFHPVLSFPHDIHLSIHCEGLLKSGLWQTKPLPRRSRVGEYRKQKVITLVTESVRKNGNNRQNGRNSNSASVINFSTKIKNKYETKKTKAAGSKVAPMKSSMNKVKKKAAKMTREAMKRNQADEEEDDLEAYLDQDFSTPGGRDNGLTGSASQSSIKDVHHRKRKVDNSFDINNIVIPLSMAASTRVEQPQYKEIVTPKWREVTELRTSPEIIECSLTNKLDKSNGVSPPSEQQQKLSDEDEVEEDLADEKFAARHIAQEQEEKKRFRNFVQYPPVRRNRARTDPLPSSGFEKVTASERTDGGEPGHTIEAAEESLPARPTTPVLNRSFHSPYVQSTNVEDSIDAIQQQLSARRRTMSFTKRERAGSVIPEDVHNPLIDVGGVEPWPRRTFPLSDEEYRLMREDLPPSCEPVHQRVARRLADPSGKVYVGGSVDNTDDVAAVPSPHPSTESLSSAGDDPNDPEWVGGDPSKRSRTRRINCDDPNDPEWTGSDSSRRITYKR